jgi:drug/metabolite transporter (DMT)-like permease
MMPFFLVLFDWLRPNGTRPGWIVSAGLILGFGGVVLLINPTQVDGVAGVNKFGAGLVMAATILWAIGSLYSRHAKQPESHSLFAGMQMMAGGAVALLVALLMGEFNEFNISSLTPLSFWSWVYLTLFGSFAFGVYLWLLKVTTPAKVATYAYVNPVIAILLGALFAGEELSSWTLGCSMIIILAVVIIITARSREQKNGLQLKVKSEEKKTLIASASLTPCANAINKPAMSSTDSCAPQ